MGRILTANRYATVTSTLALIIALGGGTAYAAELITSKGIKDGAVKRVDIARRCDQLGQGRRRHVVEGRLHGWPASRGSRRVRRLHRVPRARKVRRGRQDLPDLTELVYVRTGPLGAEPGITTSHLFCPAGLLPTGWGGSASGSSEELAMHASYPFDDNMLGAEQMQTRYRTTVGRLNSSTVARILSWLRPTLSALRPRLSEEFVTVSSVETTTQRSAGKARVIARP